MAEASIKHIGRYEIQAELGRGGYGRVYRAYDPTVGRLVAIKVLTGEGTDLLKRFRNEASAAGSLNHRNIVTIYDFGEHDGMPYIAMEFLAGDDLSQVIANRTPLTMLQKVNIMMQVAEGLYSAHRNGVVHRDVKPANIRLLPDGTVKILDFGIARLTRDGTSPRLTRQGDVIGTLLYMSPEQIMSADVDALSDIFAYGVTYYELLTGKHPFHAADAGAVLYKITSVDPEPINNHTPECPEALVQVVRRALHRERELRYQSLRELQIDTEPILIELRQKQASVLLNDARNCFSENDLERAEAHVMEALALDPSNNAAREFRNEVQQRLQSRRLQSRIDAILAEGDQALKQRRFAEATERFQSALQVYPENEKLKGRLQQARELLERSRAAAQLLADARKHFFQKDYRAALRIASEAAQVDPECTDVARFVQSVQTAAEREERRLRFQQILGAAQELLDQNLFDQAADALAELDSEQRDAAEAKALIDSINTRRADFERAEREQAERIRTELAAATEELRNSAFLQAFERLSTLRREVPENEGIAQLLALAEEQLNAQKRAAEIDVLVREALSFVESDQYGRALDVIEDGLRSYAGDARLLQLLKEVKAGQERVASIRSALADAKTQLEAGRPEEAVQVLEPVSAKFAGEADLERLLGQAREALAKKQKVEAIERAEREVKALVKAEEFDKALAAIAAIRRQHGDDPPLAELSERIGRAREDRRRAVAVQAAAANAEALIQAGRPEEAIRILEPASAEFPSEPQLGRVLAQAREALQKKQKCEAIERAVREVQALVEAGEFDNAQKSLRAALRKYPQEARLLELRNQIQTARAGRELQQALPPQEVPQQLEPKVAERSLLITPRRAIAVAAVLVAGIGAVLVVRQINAPAGGTIPVEVRTSPTGAVVRYKDGSCTAPDCRLQLAPGDYAFEVQLPGYRTETRKTTVVKNSAPVSLEIALSALPSTVQLTTTFADGSVTLNGRTAGRLRDGQFIADNLGPGRHELEAKGGDGEVRLTFETGEAKRPLLSSPPSTRDADAVVVTAFGNEAAVNCARCNGEAVLDGKPVGRFVGGQLVLKGVSAGTHELQIGGGAAPRKLVFAVGTQPSLVTYLTSARDRGILLVQTGLDDAVVYIGGKQWPRRTERGELSIPLDAKEYEVRVEKQGYRAVPPVVRAAVRKGEQVRAPFRFEPLEAVLTITGQVPGATVSVDRKVAGAVSGNGVFSVQVQPGERRIELSKDGYQPVAISRSFSPGESLQLGTDQLRLQPIPRPAPEPAPVKAASPPPPPQPSPAELEAQQWQRVRDSRDISDLAEFLTRYPGGRFAREAEARIEELEWSATNRNNLASLEAFLAKHPRGTLGGEARKEIARLQQEEQRRSEAAAVLATVSRYEEAYRRRDAAGVRALYLNMPNNQFDQIRKSFSVFQVISFQLKPEEPQFAGDTATVRCVRMLTVKDNRGAERTANDVALFGLKKEGNQWRIVSLSTLN